MKRLRLAVLAVAVLALVGVLAGVHAARAANVNTGTLDFAANPYDDYQFYITTGTAVVIALDCNPPPDTLDPYLQVYTPGMFLYNGDDDGLFTSCAGYSGSYLSFTAPLSGMWTIRACSWDYCSGGSDFGTGDGNYTLTVTCDGGDCPITGPAGGAAPESPCPDGRVNCAAGDEYVVIYYRSNLAALDFYCIDLSGNGYFGGRITRARLASFPAEPSENTLVRTIDCRVPVSFYILDTGQYQINIGPDIKGNTVVLIFVGLPPTFMEVLRLDADH